MRVLIRLLVCMSVFLVLSAARTVSADCCVCLDCGGGAARVCRSPELGCDVSDCPEICSSCDSFQAIDGVSCDTVEACASTVPVPAFGPLGQAGVGLLLLAVGLYALTRSPRLVRGAAVVAVFFGSVVLVRAVGSIVLSGTWSSSAPSSESSASQVWSIDLSDPLAETLEGTVTIDGGSAASGGTFHGRRQGDQVTGTITDGGGAVIAELTATLSDGLLSGTYTTPGGASGTFSAELTSS